MSRPKGIHTKQRKIVPGMRFGDLVVDHKVYGPHFPGEWWCTCDCGHHRPVRAALLNNGQVKHCGRKNNHGAVRRIRRETEQGYVEIQTGAGWKKQHRVVMERHLGRDLLPNEEIHHINGIRNDNRLENLELWSTSHPPGQRVIDKVAWAKEILAIYGGCGGRPRTHLSEDGNGAAGSCLS